MTTILIIGSSGFVGRHLVAHLSANPDVRLLLHRHTDAPSLLAERCAAANYIIHLAGVCRPQHPSEFYAANVQYLQQVLATLQSLRHPCPILLASSIQASLEGCYQGSEYGRTKQLAEQALLQYSRLTGARVIIYRLPHLYGPWGTPCYNNVMHTFCHHIAQGLPIRIDNAATVLTLAYISDVVAEFLQSLFNPDCCGYISLRCTSQHTLGEVVQLLRSFQQHTLDPASCTTHFQHNLYSTFVSYLPQPCV